MQAIVVKYIPATNTLPTRLKAYAAAGCIVRSRDSLMESNPARHIAQMLADDYGWKGDLIEGGLPNGDTVFVFAPALPFKDAREALAEIMPK